MLYNTRYNYHTSNYTLWLLNNDLSKKILNLISLILEPIKPFKKHDLICGTHLPGGVTVGVLKGLIVVPTLEW